MPTNWKHVPGVGWFKTDEESTTPNALKNEGLGEKIDKRQHPGGCTCRKCKSARRKILRRMLEEDYKKLRGEE